MDTDQPQKTEQEKLNDLYLVIYKDFRRFRDEVWDCGIFDKFLPTYEQEALQLAEGKRLYDLCERISNLNYDNNDEFACWELPMFCQTMYRLERVALLFLSYQYFNNWRETGYFLLQNHSYLWKKYQRFGLWRLKP